MTLLYTATDAKKYDVRLLERNVARGLVAAEDIQKNVSELADDSENAAYVSIDSLMNEGAVEVKSELSEQAQTSAQSHH